MNERAEKINTLLLDNRFVDWALNPQSPYSQYWLQWIALNTANVALAEEAKQFLLDLRSRENEREKEIDEAYTAQMWTHIEQAIEQEKVIALNRPRRQKTYWLAAAVVVGCILFSAVMFFRQPEYQRVAASQAIKKITLLLK